LLSLNYQPNAGAISVGIIKARNLKAKDINGLSGLSTLSSLLRPLCDTVRDDNGSAGHKYCPVTHVTHSDLLTHLSRDPLTHDQVNKIPRTGYFDVRF